MAAQPAELFTRAQPAGSTVGLMRILHLTDTHLYADPDARHYGRIDTRAAFAAVLDRLRTVEDVDLVVHAGDASEDGSEESYRVLHAMLDAFAESLDAQLAVAMGNHDVPAAYAAAIAPGDRGDHVQDRVLDVPGGGRCVVLDSSVPGAGYGHLEPEQLDWLRRVLEQPAPEGPDGARPGTVLVIHHPPLGAATTMLRALELDGVDELGEILTGSDVRVVLSGHYHHEMNGSLAGIPVHVAPGITNVVDPVSAGEHECSYALSGASLLQLPDQPSSAVSISSATWRSGGDADGDVAVPVYDFGPEQIAQIARDAGR